MEIFSFVSLRGGSYKILARGTTSQLQKLLPINPREKHGFIVV